MAKSLWPTRPRLVNGPSALPAQLVPPDMRARRLTGSGIGRARIFHPRFNGLGQVEEGGVDYSIDELNNGPRSLAYPDVPIDMYPRNVDNYQRNPDGSISDAGVLSPLDTYLDRIARDTNIMSSIATLKRGLFGRTLTITTTPQLIVNAEYLRGYIFLNPNELAGTTSAGTMLASASRGAATANLTGNSAALGVANFLGAHFFVNISAISGGADVTIVLQALDPVSGLWFDVQDLVTGVLITGQTYAFVDALGVATDARVRWAMGAGDATFSVGFVLKNGLAGTSAGISQTIFLGSAGVTVQSGFPLLNGDKEKFFLQEGVRLYAVANASLPMKIFEL